VECLLEIVQFQAIENEVCPAIALLANVANVDDQEEDIEATELYRSELGVFLAL